MNPKWMVMGPLHLWYERLGLDSVSLADETIKEINSINVNEDADADQLRHRLLKNFYDAEISVLVARFVVAEAILNTSKSGDQMFRNMIDVRDHVYTAIVYWLREHKVTYDRNSLWDELRDLGTLCSKKKYTGQ